jgi:hypothetical protein
MSVRTTRYVVVKRSVTMIKNQGRYNFFCGFFEYIISMQRVGVDAVGNVHSGLHTLGLRC